jgi:RimJ/RimL family protein N-acetyltransferase
MPHLRRKGQEHMTAEPLDETGRQALADALGDTPTTTIPVHALRRGFCRAYAVGDLSGFDAAIVQWDDLPDEPFAFGSDAEAVWGLLRQVGGWRAVNVGEELATPLGALMERDIGHPVRYYGDLYHTLNSSPPDYRHPLVRSLSTADAALVEAAPRAIQGAGFGAPEAMLREGIVAGAVDGGRLVAIAHTGAITERYSDIGVATLEPYRGQGISTAAAALVCEALREWGRTPVWSCGEGNEASRRVAEKLGFVLTGRRVYLIPGSR